jgi:hypothetical protein
MVTPGRTLCPTRGLLSPHPVTKGSEAVQSGIQKVVESTYDPDMQFKIWTSKAAEAMSAPFDTGVQKTAVVKAAGETMPAAFEKTGESIIMVFDSARNAIEGGLTGGLLPLDASVGRGLRHQLHLTGLKPMNPIVLEFLWLILVPLHCPPQRPCFCSGFSGVTYSRN